MRKTLFALMFVLIIGHIAKAQEPSIWLAGMEMRLGMPQDVVMKRILENYDLEPFGNVKDNYLIVERQRKDVGDKNPGNIAFAQGRLVFAAKEWYIYNAGSDRQLFDALYAVLSEMERKGETVASIQTTTSKEPGETLESILLTSSKRTVRIHAAEIRGSKGVQVTETIRAPRPQ